MYTQLVLIRDDLSCAWIWRIKNPTFLYICTSTHYEHCRDSEPVHVVDEVDKEEDAEADQLAPPPYPLHLDDLLRHPHGSVDAVVLRSTAAAIITVH